MNTATKKQHYVWRKYLNPWKLSPEERKVWTYIIKSNKVEYISLMDVAQESYFYKMYELSPVEIHVCWNFARQLPSFVWSFADTLLKGYEAISYDMMSETDKRDFALHSIDHMQTNFERMGTPLLNCQSLDDLKNIKDKYQTIFFLCVQYCRTNKMREVGIEGYKDYPMKSELYKKVFPYISLLVATTLGHNLVVGNPNTRYIFVRNETSIPFITCDQPVINLKKDDVDENGFAKDLEFYYPISPSTAIMISQNAQLKEYSEIIADESFVENKNRKMCENASLFIFANNEEMLRRIMTSERGTNDV